MVCFSWQCVQLETVWSRVRNLPYAGSEICSLQDGGARVTWPLTLWLLKISSPTLPCGETLRAEGTCARAEGTSQSPVPVLYGCGCAGCQRRRCTERRMYGCGCAGCQRRRCTERRVYGCGCAGCQRRRFRERRMYGCGCAGCQRRRCTERRVYGCGCAGCQRRRFRVL
jgi:hypothetical protein